jgi:NAD(P)-dependent dehydrogenase (short-subunit alcohol dehydrogenase family)
MEKKFGFEFDLSENTMITGCAGGIGLAIAEAFARYGADIALCDIQSDAVEAAASRIRSDFGVRANPYTLDVTKADQIESVAV